MPRFPKGVPPRCEGRQRIHPIVETNTYLELIHAYIITTYILYILCFPSISHIYIYLSIDILRICRRIDFIHICCTKIRAVGPTLAERALHGSRARLLRGERVVGLVDSVGLRNRAPLLFVAVYLFREKLLNLGWLRVQKWTLEALLRFWMIQLI